MPQSLQRLLLVGDAYGIPDLLSHIPRERVVGVVVAANRPNSHAVAREAAQLAQLPCFVQPPRDEERYGDFAASIDQLAPDGLICHSYAMLIPGDLIARVDGNGFNVHMALLPRHRGPNPIQWALIHGDRRAGVTIHVMDETFDSGPIVAQAALDIEAGDTWVTLFARLKSLTGVLLENSIPALLDGTWHGTPQDTREAIHNSRIGPESFAIDFSAMTDEEIVNLVRAQITPLAGAYLDGPHGRVRFTSPMTTDDVALLRKQFGAAVHV